ncbi:alpha/beta fold hydrolase [Dankookia sp. P2]|uniref:alpha/beta fold hydrolase n=1 Tax=Dankookia sp. P2 TaxID=3423955 RepID=UPI003D668E40
MRAAIRDTELYFDIDGPGLVPDGPVMRERPVGFAIHGGPGGDHSGFKPGYAALTQAMQVVYFDHRGQGRSARGDPDRWTLDENVEDMEALRRHLGCGPIVSIGTSYGGMVAMAHAARYPDAVSHLVLVVTAAHGGFIPRAQQILAERGTPEQQAICAKVWSGGFEDEAELKRYYRIMGPLYAARHDPAKAEDGLARAIHSPEALNRALQAGRLPPPLRPAAGTGADRSADADPGRRQGLDLPAGILRGDPCADPRLASRGRRGIEPFDARRCAGAAVRRDHRLRGRGLSAMATEIERKSLVAGEGWRSAALGPGLRLRQGYLPNGGDAATPVVRVRLAGADGFLTIKGPGLLSRAEFEYPIPAAEAEAMLATLCAQPVLEKTRTRVAHGGLVWEVDVFAGHLAGLVLAEVELASADQPFARPDWAGAEVTGDKRYQNNALARASAMPGPGPAPSP